jgi:ferritin-like metal-binding protein YciE
MSTMSDPRELFLHELGDLLYAEKQLLKALPKLATEATDAELQAGFEHHQEQTEGHVARLEEVFESLGEPAKAERCPGIEGILTEHDEFIAKEDPSPKVRDLFLTGAGARAEHYEIAAYSGLVTMAQSLGERSSVDILKENLDEEKETLKALETAAARLGKAASNVAGSAA